MKFDRLLPKMPMTLGSLSLCYIYKQLSCYQFRHPVLSAMCFFIICGCTAYIMHLAATFRLLFDTKNILKDFQSADVCSNSSSGAKHGLYCETPIYKSSGFHEINQVLDTEFFETMSMKLNIKPGGKWAPADCDSLQKVAIIVPYRNRLYQLRLFLQHMHPFLQAQKLDYTIVVVEQTFTHSFNRGKLLNVGFMETSKDKSFCCFIFHDVDLLPENSHNLYGCTQQPRHMCSSINTFRYVLPYKELFGGVVAFSRSQFQSVNGYSNYYFGWGGEDDDLYNRVIMKGFHIHRWSSQVQRYIMLKHKKAVPNKERHSLLETSITRMGEDGLNTLTYRIVAESMHPLYTHILVSI